MTNEEWEEQRNRVIMAAIQTGRPVFGDSDGELRYADGDKEPVPADVVAPKQPVPRAVARGSWWSRLTSWLRGRRS